MNRAIGLTVIAGGLLVAALLSSRAPSVGLRESVGLVTGSPDIPGQVLASVDSEDRSVRLEILDVRTLSGETLEIRFAFVNPSEKEPRDVDRFGERPGEGGALSAAFLTPDDRAVRHFVLRDRGGQPSCHTLIRALGPGERQSGRACFSRPGGPGTRFTLQVPGMPPVAGLVVPAEPEGTR